MRQEGKVVNRTRACISSILTKYVALLKHIYTSICLKISILAAASLSFFNPSRKNAISSVCVCPINKLSGPHRTTHGCARYNGKSMR